MKDKQQLRIPVRGTNRKYFLVRPSPNRPDFCVRFQTPADLRRRDPKLPHVVFRSTGTDLLQPAKLRAREIIEAVLQDRFADAELFKLRVECATIGEILDAYRPAARTVKRQTVVRNKSALELLLREATGKSSVRNLRADVLTGKLLRDWMRARTEAVAERDLVAQERAAITLNSTLAMARSVVSPKVAECYEHLKLPDLAGFRSVKKLQVDADVSYAPLPNECLTKINESAQLLRRGVAEVPCGGRMLSAQEQAAVYVVYLLMSRLGLRNCEAFAARWGWLERREDGSAELVLKRRPDFTTKNKRYRSLDIAPELLAELDAFRGLPEAWVVPAPTKTERHYVCYRWINAWLRPFIPPGREKGAYELRKHAGSVIVSRPESENGGIVAAAAFLGDTIATSEKHYASYLRKIRGIRSSELAAA